MSVLHDWPPAPVLGTERLSLEPLRVDHAEEMAPLLDDAQLFVFTGGSPRTLEELRSRYEQQATTWSVDGCERWLNWIVRDRTGGTAVGGVQATLTLDGDAVVAELAWIVGSRYQRQGYAREAAVAMAAWLREQGARILLADIHPEHQASIMVARALELTPGEQVLASGEIRWTG